MVLIFGEIYLLIWGIIYERVNMKIAVWHNLPSGGGKRQLYYHIKGLIEQGHYVESWCTSTAASSDFLPLSDLIKENVVPLDGFSPKFNHTFRNKSTVKSLINAMERHCQKCAEQINSKGFDVLFINACAFLRTSSIAEFATIPTVLYLGEPYRWFYESLPSLPWRDFSSIWLNAGIKLQALKEVEYARATDLILVNSLYSRESVLKSYSLESKVCYLGVDSNYYKILSSTKKNYVIGLGTLYHAKGIDRAIKAIATIEKVKRPPLVWIGNGAWQDDLNGYIALAKALEVDFIYHLNVTDDFVLRSLNEASVMLYTSRLEPFGLSPLEANACGTGVVGIAEGGFREIIIDGVNGFLTSNEDYDELGRLILTFTSNLVYAAEFGKQCRIHVEKHWSIKKCSSNIENYLRNVINIKGGTF